MANLNVSAAHSLQLVPIDRLSKFAQIKTGVMLVYLSQPDNANAIPGSIRITTSIEGGVIKKSITYKRRTVDRTTANLLEGYKVTRLVAVYTDETGNKRVAGSPDYPLKFSYTSSDGVFTCKLEGESLTIDPFLI
ncbi:hypothetical protein [Paramuribaculum intestinale]|uniref:hypothetical protein n=2 Tax=Muribaculaceae TaxID=2005473 RepID=UPI0025B7A2B4|nr:hypothetical protein [Paramuribaculum intestinale]